MTNKNKKITVWVGVFIVIVLWLGMEARDANMGDHLVRNDTPYDLTVKLDGPNGGNCSRTLEPGETKTCRFNHRGVDTDVFIVHLEIRSQGQLLFTHEASALYGDSSVHYNIQYAGGYGSVQVTR